MKLYLALPFLLAPIFALAQKNQLPHIHIPQDSANIQRLKEINRDIWAPFAEAYAMGDADKYISLHAPDFIRATGGDWSGIKNLEEYRTSSRRQFNRDKESGSRSEIAFTFFERVAGANAASERGFYKYTAIDKDGKRADYYGKFHVFLRKINGTWKIAVDYDSDEDGSIGEADFEAGLAPAVFSK